MLVQEFPAVAMALYVDDAAFITRDRRMLLKVLHRVTQLSHSLGFQANPAKTQIYMWSPKHRQRVIKWNADTIMVRVPIFTYLGHTIAHPQYHRQAQDLFLLHVSADIARYTTWPLNAFERAQLVNMVLLSKWTYTSSFTPADSMFVHVDKEIGAFVTKAKGIEKRHNVMHVSDPVSKGGLGLHHMYRAHRMKFLSVIQRTLRDPAHTLAQMASIPVHHKIAPLRNYVHIIKQLGGCTPVTLAASQRPRGGPHLIGEEEDEDYQMMCARKQMVGLPQYAGHYISFESTRGHTDASTVPEGFTKIHIGGHECYTNNLAGRGNKCKVEQCTAIGKISFAGMGILHGEKQLVARVTCPQCSYRAKLLGATIVPHLAQANDDLASDNQAVVRTAAHRPRRECANMYLLHEAHTNFQRTPVHIRWIPSYQRVEHHHTMHPKSPHEHPLETPLELGDPNRPSSRKLQTPINGHATWRRPLYAPSMEPISQ